MGPFIQKKKKSKKTRRKVWEKKQINKHKAETKNLREDENLAFDKGWQGLEQAVSNTIILKERQ